MKPNFPVKVFEDVKSSDFVKFNKKHVTEDYVSENFKEFGWDVYRPFTDTGIDLIASKKICPKNHTKWHEKTNDQTTCKYNNCNEKLIRISRFIQVKTREVKGDSSSSQFFGYTLKSKDFRTDPRHVFLLFSDYTDHLIILPMYEYLSIFYNSSDMGKAFAVPSFRKGNNKLNSLRFDNTTKTWTWNTKNSKISFDKYVNQKGMELIVNPDYDTKLDYYIDKIKEMKLKLFYNYSGENQVSSSKETLLKSHLANQVQKNLKSITSERAKIKNDIDKKITPEIKDSIAKYNKIK